MNLEYGQVVYFIKCTNIIELDLSYCLIELIIYLSKRDLTAGDRKCN